MLPFSRLEEGKTTGVFFSALSYQAVRSNIRRHLVFASDKRRVALPGLRSCLVASVTAGG
jgi:hypothetical protein